MCCVCESDLSYERCAQYKFTDSRVVSMIRWMCDFVEKNRNIIQPVLTIIGTGISHLGDKH